MRIWQSYSSFVFSAVGFEMQIRLFQEYQSLPFYRSVNGSLGVHNFLIVIDQPFWLTFRPLDVPADRRELTLSSSSDLLVKVSVSKLANVSNSRLTDHLLKCLSQHVNYEGYLLQTLYCFTVSEPISNWSPSRIRCDMWTLYVKILLSINSVVEVID